MCRGIRCITTGWTKNHFNVTLVKKFHRRKHNRRAVNKFFKSQDYYHHLGKSVGIIFILSFKNKNPQLLIKLVKQEELKAPDPDIDSSSDTDSESSYCPVALAC